SASLPSGALRSRPSTTASNLVQTRSAAAAGRWAYGGEDRAAAAQVAAPIATSVPRTRSRRRLSLSAVDTQAEFSLTQVLDQPVIGGIFFEEVIRENLDIGRPSQVSLIFERKITRRTPGRFCTRVITDGVVPTLHIDYKKSRIKQYHKLLEALRTETTINDT